LHLPAAGRNPKEQYLKVSFYFLAFAKIRLFVGAKERRPEKRFVLTLKIHKFFTFVPPKRYKSRRSKNFVEG
jgi:hypothetical protein